MFMNNKKKGPYRGKSSAKMLGKGFCEKGEQICVGEMEKGISQLYKNRS